MATPAFGAQAGTEAEPNNAALYDARRRQTLSGTGHAPVLDEIISGSNFDKDEVDRLKKRFMKLDKVSAITVAVFGVFVWVAVAF